MTPAVGGLVVATLLGSWVPARAKTISITISQRTEIRDGSLVAHVTVGNSGDESAKAVAATLRFGEAKSKGKLHDDLAPNGSFQEDLTVQTGTLGEGRWPYEIAVDYADANLYPFQALLVTTIVVGSPSTPKVSVPEISSVGIAESGELTIKVKNLENAARDVSYRIVVPEGLEATEPKGRLQLAPWDEETTSIDVVNRTALAGSRYPVFVALEYDEGGVHQALVAQGTVEIVPPSDFWEENRTLLFGGAAVLVALWLGLVVRRATSRKG
jgi:hypothetical protein